jgi:hypothetical protein
VRPGEKYPVYELDSIDIEQIRLGKSLNLASIVWHDRPHGYFVGDLDEARIRFTEVCDVHTEWGSNHELDRQNCKRQCRLISMVVETQP